MLIETNPHEEFAQALRPNATLETEGIQDRDDQTDERCAAFTSFPKPGLGVAISAHNRLFKPVHATLGKPCLLSDLANAWVGMTTQGVENK